MTSDEIEKMRLRTNGVGNLTFLFGLLVLSGGGIVEIISQPWGIGVKVMAIGSILVAWGAVICAMGKSLK